MIPQDKAYKLIRTQNINISSAILERQKKSPGIDPNLISPELREAKDEADALKESMAKENARLSSLSDAPIRYIVDDCKKFIEREIRRGRKYDAIIMDPPSYGRGPTGEVWKIEESIDDFVKLSSEVLSDNPLFFLLNSYTTGLSASTMKYITDIRLLKKRKGHSEADELGLPIDNTGLVLPCGSSVRVIFEK
jgi:23S rRNA (cytosine1962-C5)-methyltransferase